MWNKISIPALASFLLGNGVAGVLAYFGNKPAALIVSVVSTITGAVLGIWWLVDSRKKSKSNVTAESIKNDIEKRVLAKRWFQFIVFIVFILIVSVGVQLFIYRQTTYIEQTRPILSLEPNVKSVSYDIHSFTANISVEYTLLNLRDKPSYQTQVRFAACRDIDPSNVVTLPDQYIINPIYKTANHQVIETFTIHPRSPPVMGQIAMITYSSIKYADAPSGKVHWYAETWWYALTMHFDASGQLIKVDNQEVDPSLFPQYEASILSKFPDELGANK